MIISATKAKPMATPEGQARNKEVYRTAVQFMVRQSYGGTSINDIAKAIGITKAGLYHHINSKQDMLFQILQHALDRLERVVIEPAKVQDVPETRLRETIKLRVRGIIDHGPELTLLFPERHHLDLAQQEVIAKRIQNYWEFVRDALREMTNQGKLRDLDINIAQRHILQSIVGIARW